MYEWDFLFKSLAQIVIVVLVVCLLVVIVSSTWKSIRKKDE